MNPKSAALALVLLVPLAFVAGRLTLAQEPAGSEKPETVRAQRYRIVYAVSGLELGHGGGRWVEELYFPERKVACFQVWEYPPVEEWKTGERTPLRPRLIAVGGQEKARNDLTGLEDTVPSEIEEVRVPKDLAEEIFELAELRDRYEKRTLRLGKATADRKVLREIPEKGPGSKKEK